MAKTWFRIELDASGAILTCAQVDKNERDKKFVRYVEAYTTAEACSKVKAWYERKMSATAARNRDKYAAKKASGICTKCPTEAMLGKTLCTTCMHKAIVHASEYRDPCHSPKQLRPLHERAIETKRKHDETQKQYGGSGTFRSCLKRFDTLTPVDFRAWLVSEINRRSAPEKQVK